MNKLLILTSYIKFEFNSLRNNEMAMKLQTSFFCTVGLIKGVPLYCH